MTEANSETNNEKIVRNTYPDRLTVDAANLEKIGRYLDQLRAATPACGATRKDILNWIIEKVPTELSVSDLKELSDRFYDEERFLKFALEEVRAAKARGERLRLDDILRRKPQPTSAVRRSPRKRKKELELEGGEPSLVSAVVSIDPS